MTKGKTQTRKKLRINTGRDTGLEKELGDLICQAIDGKISLIELYRKTEDLKYKVIEKDPSSWDSPFSNLLLKDAIEELHLLHDSFTRDYHRQENYELLKEYADCLLGRRERAFKVVENGQNYEIIYPPYAKRKEKKVKIHD